MVELRGWHCAPPRSHARAGHGGLAAGRWGLGQAVVPQGPSQMRLSVCPVLSPRSPRALREA